MELQKFNSEDKYTSLYLIDLINKDLKLLNKVLLNAILR